MIDSNFSIPESLQSYYDELIKLHRKPKVSNKPKDTPPKGRKSKSWREKLILTQIFKLKDQITWLQSARLSTSPEDHRGIDIVVESDAGELCIQVLATESGKRSGLSYWMRHPRANDIGVLWVSESFKKKPEKAAVVLARLLTQLYRRKLHIWTW